MKTKNTPPKHTTGPWFASIHAAAGGEPAFAVIRAVDTIAGMRQSGDYSEETFAANAQLIAAAPDLYAACEAAAEYVMLRTPGGTSDPLHHKLLAALVRAKGGDLEGERAARDVVAADRAKRRRPR